MANGVQFVVISLRSQLQRSSVVSLAIQAARSWSQALTHKALVPFGWIMSIVLEVRKGCGYVHSMVGANTIVNTRMMSVSLAIHHSRGRLASADLLATKDRSEILVQKVHQVLRAVAADLQVIQESREKEDHAGIQVRKATFSSRQTSS